MEKITAKYAIFNNRFLTLYDDKSFSCLPLYEDVIENVVITFNENNSITLEGDFWQWNIHFCDEYTENIDYEVHPDYIELTRFRKKPIVRKGWHRKLNNEHKTIIFNNYKIIKNGSN